MQAITNIDPTAMVPSVTPTAWSVPELSSKQIKKNASMLHVSIRKVTFKIVEIPQDILFICCIVHTVTF